LKNITPIEPKTMIFGQGMGNFDNFHEVPVKLAG
jgi:hypothetical protein